MEGGDALSLKSTHRKRQWQEVRRADALQRQRSHRQVSIDHARRLGDIKTAVEEAPQEVMLSLLTSACYLALYMGVKREYGQTPCRKSKGAWHR